jgi:nucleoside-diphosphate-sugar epimerase
MSRILITGANGFIGSHFVRFFSSGNDVVALSRTRPIQMPERSSWQHYSLEEGADQAIFEGGDYLIHCALATHSQRNSNSSKVNADGTAWLRRICHRNNYRRFVFLSSLSAHPDARSHYGRSKLAIQESLDPNEDLILRPGLVIGRGGLFQRMVTVMESTRFLPLIDGGRQPIQTVSIDDLCRVLDALLAAGITGAHDIASEQNTSLFQLYQLIAGRLGRKPVFVYVPFVAAMTAVRIAEALGLPAPLNSDNLFGLKYARTAAVANFRSDYGITLRSPRESIEDLFADSGDV